MSAPALRRGMRILELAARSERGVRFSQLHRELSIPSASAARLLNELVDMGYLVKDEDGGRYLPGPRLGELAPASSLRHRLTQAAGGVLHELAQATGNTSLVIYWDGARMHCVAKEEHPDGLGMQRVGEVSTDLLVPPWGWVFYQTLDEKHRARLRARSRAAGSDLRAIERNLASLSRDGYVVKKNRDASRTRRIAAPVRCPGVGIVGALAMGGTAITIPDQQVPVLGRLLVRKAAELEEMVAGRSREPDPVR